MAREAREDRSSAKAHEQLTPAEKLRALLRQDGLLSFPCCYDALSARLIERAGFPLSFSFASDFLDNIFLGLRAPERLAGY